MTQKHTLRAMASNYTRRHSWDKLKAENERLENDHGDLVLRNKVLRERPDLAADRISCHDQVIALQANRDQLRAEIAGLKTGYEAHEAQNAALRGEVEALRKDAGRYRWLKDSPYSGGCLSAMRSGDLTGIAADDAIDSAMVKVERS